MTMTKQEIWDALEALGKEAERVRMGINSLKYEIEFGGEEEEEDGEDPTCECGEVGCNHPELVL